MRIAVVAALGIVGFAIMPASNAGTVSGVVRRSPSGYGPPVAQTQGFVERRRTPLKKPDSFDPFPYLIVVMEGAPSAKRTSVPREPVSWKLIGASFAVPLLPIRVGREVEIRNVGRSSPQLRSPEEPDLLPPGPINPNGVRPFVLKEPYRSLRIRSHHAAHIFGRVVAFPHPYFSRVNRDGGFEIPNVPAGTWKLRVWYQDGWLDVTSVVEVVAQRAIQRESITLPRKLVPKVPDQKQ